MVDISMGNPNNFLDLELNKLLASIRSIKKWSTRHAEVLDHIYRYRMVRCFTGCPTAENLRELWEHLRRVSVIAQTEAANDIDKKWSVRWRGYADIIDTHFAMIRTSQP